MLSYPVFGIEPLYDISFLSPSPIDVNKKNIVSSYGTNSFYVVVLEGFSAEYNYHELATAYVPL